MFLLIGIIFDSLDWENPEVFDNLLSLIITSTARGPESALRGTVLHPGPGAQCPVLGWPLVNVHWEQPLQPGNMVSKNSASRPGTCQRGLFRFWEACCFQVLLGFKGVCVNFTEVFTAKLAEAYENRLSHAPSNFSSFVFHFGAFIPQSEREEVISSK